MQIKSWHWASLGILFLFSPTLSVLMSDFILCGKFCSADDQSATAIILIYMLLAYLIFVSSLRHEKTAKIAAILDMLAGIWITLSCLEFSAYRGDFDWNLSLLSSIFFLSAGSTFFWAENKKAGEGFGQTVRK